MIFSEGIQVTYKEHTGIIRFISEQYLTICIRTFTEKSRDVCILVYREDYKDIRLIKESIK